MPEIPGGDDLFSKLTLDDNFVSGASQRELSAEDRMRTASRVLQQQHEQVLLADQLRDAGRIHGRTKRSLRLKVLVILTGLLMVAGALWSTDISPKATESATSPAVTDHRTSGTVVTVARPTLSRAQSSVPLGMPPSIPTNAGPYLFMETQPGTSEPVAYDPCRPIKVVVNNAKAPKGGDQLIADAMEGVAKATGLDFVMEGPTDEPYTADRSSYQPDRYGDRWAPVLVTWSDPTEMPDLKDDIAGIGGSSSLTDNVGSPEVYVSGRIVLDGPQIAQILKHKGGTKEARGIVLHEFGHVVGLDHVNDAKELMNPVGNGDVVDFQSGDRAGLAQLGRGACLPQL